MNPLDLISFYQIRANRSKVMDSTLSETSELIKNMKISGFISCWNDSKKTTFPIGVRH